MSIILLTNIVPTYQIPEPEKQDFGLPIGNHIMVGGQVDGSFVVRPYTPTHPTTPQEDQGHFDLVIKIYPHGA